ncbi:MAG: hypothetical protein NTZ97_03105 [Candidatus Moranbacteria bacterium]|nr:hypothetical protein [Candidatus Moranbacteria bacterium]
MLIAEVFTPGKEDKREIIFNGLLLTDQNKIKLEAELSTHRVLNKAFPGELPSFSFICSDTKGCISFSEDLSAKLGLPAKIEADGPPSCAHAKLCRLLVDMGKI